MAPKKSLPLPASKSKQVVPAPQKDTTAASPAAATAAAPGATLEPTSSLVHRTNSGAGLKSLSLEMEKQAAQRVPTALSGLITMLIDDAAKQGAGALPTDSFVALRVLHRLQGDRYAAAVQARDAMTAKNGQSTPAEASAPAASIPEVKSSSPSREPSMTAPKKEEAPAAAPSATRSGEEESQQPESATKPNSDLSAAPAADATATAAPTSKPAAGAATGPSQPQPSETSGPAKKPTRTASNAGKLVKTTEKPSAPVAAPAAASSGAAPSGAAPTSPVKARGVSPKKAAPRDPSPAPAATAKPTKATLPPPAATAAAPAPVAAASTSSPAPSVTAPTTAVSDSMLLAALLVAADPSHQPLTTALAQSAVAPQGEAAAAGSSSPPALRRQQRASPSRLRQVSPSAEGDATTGGGRSPTRTIVRPSSPTSPEAIEASRRIKSQMKKTQELRAERRRLEQEKITRDLAEADEATKRALQRQEEERREKERQLNDRLEQLRAKREERELEYMIGERRAQKILRAKTLYEDMEEQFELRQREERREKELEWLKKRDQLRAPLTEGLGEVAKRLRENEERKQRREAELKESWKMLEQQQMSVYQGASYSLAVDEYIKAKHVQDDEKHARLYRHAKMQEYGRIVKAMVDAADDAEGDDNNRHSGFGLVPRRHSHAGTPTPMSSLAAAAHQQQSRITPHTPPPFDASPLPHLKPLASPTVPKPSLTPHERNQYGNNYLKQAILLKSQTPLPPGLKVAPLDDDRTQQDFDRFKLRKKKGDQYLRDLRAMELTPAPPVVDEFEFVGDVRRLKTKVHRLEREAESIAAAVHHSTASGDSPNRALAQAERKKRKQRFQPAKAGDGALSIPDDPLEADIVANEKFLEMVKTKVELLSKIAAHP